MLLGHLKLGSIRVKFGDVVSEDEWLAEAGNSGYSERPHIHMQLIESNLENFWKGKGISIQYKGINLFKNRLIEVN
jgi:murein DD-endopeptidase MepM/ murein hydrolase activator NlpD